ncbi:hypothetical protein B6U93_00390 [Candidatus Woesearchaeota archaeon ex4484_78]|nr:MAG: hypothetical protein B6U93_00390 [Candidatus Woesearchaeota archaeon ex4484_78]
MLEQTKKEFLKIQIQEDVLESFFLIARKMEHLEFFCFMYGEPENPEVVTQIEMPRQYVNSVHVTADKETTQQLLHQKVQEDKKLLGWCHSHGNFSVFHSSDDSEESKLLLENYVQTHSILEKREIKRILTEPRKIQLVESSTEIILEKKIPQETRKLLEEILTNSLIRLDILDFKQVYSLVTNRKSDLFSRIDYYYKNYWDANGKKTGYKEHVGVERIPSSKKPISEEEAEQLILSQIINKEALTQLSWYNKKSKKTKRKKELEQKQEEFKYVIETPQKETISEKIPKKEIKITERALIEINSLENNYFSFEDYDAETEIKMYDKPALKQYFDVLHVFTPDVEERIQAFELYGELEDLFTKTFEEIEAKIYALKPDLTLLKKIQKMKKFLEKYHLDNDS